VHAGRAVRRGVAALAVAVLLPLAGCGEDAGASYCSDLERSRKKLAEMVESESGTAAPLLGNRPLLRELADAAPSDVADEWQTFLGALDGLADTLREADVKPSQFEDGKPPAGLDAADRKAIADAADELGSDDVVAAVSGIEQQARDVCKVNFGL
jgi:hypothetical protein